MKTIAWDVDDVLNDLMRVWFEQKWLVEHPECMIRYEGITENPPHRLLKSGIDEYLKSLDEFRLSALYQQMPPVKEVREWFAKHGHRFRHIALTAAPLIAVSASAQWMFRNFGTWIRTFHFIPSERQGQDIPKYDRDKAAFLRWLEKADVLIDDNMANINDAEKIGVRGVLFPRPWNNSTKSIEQNEKSITEALSNGVNNR